MLPCQKSHFLLPEDVVYLNGSYMSPNLRSVEKAGIDAVKRKSLPYLIKAPDFFSMNERVREAYAKLINADEQGRIVLIPSVSYGISNAARNIPLYKGDKTLLLGEQFPSNVYPWLRRAEESRSTVEFVDPPGKMEGRAKAWNERILQSIDSVTKVVSMAHAHWTDGTLFDLEAIRKRTDEVGAYFILDCTQTIGAFPFDLSVIKPDAVVVAAYKWLLGPYSMGLAYYGPRFDDGKPLEENWMNRLNSQDFSGLVNYQDRYQALSNRYEVGERSNFALLPMLLESLNQLNRWTPEDIQGYCRSLSYPIADRLRELGFWLEEEEYRGGHLFGIRLPECIQLDKLKSCMEKSNIFVSFRGTSIRVSQTYTIRKMTLKNCWNAFNSEKMRLY